MTPFNLNQDPQNFARIFSHYVKAIVWILIWAIIALASLAGAYVAIRGIWIAVKLILKAVGI